MDLASEQMKQQQITFGSVTLRQVGGDAVVSLRAHPSLEIKIPARRVEQWLLRRLRDETMRPAEKAAA